MTFPTPVRLGAFHRWAASPAQGGSNICRRIYVSTQHGRSYHADPQCDLGASVEPQPWSASSPSGPGLPVQIDLLEKYRGLVVLGRIKYCEEQIRVIMQLRRLQKELVDYAPPAFTSGLLRCRQTATDSTDKPWWSHSPHEETNIDSRALVKLKGYVEELSSLDTPKGILLTGPPGSGKSFLVDLWFSSLPTPFKTRKHYSQLVLEIYRAVWEETQRRMATLPSRSLEVEMAGKIPWNKALREQWRGLLRTGSLPTRWSRTHKPLASDPSMAFVIARRLVLRHWLLVFDEVQLLDVSSSVLLADVMSWYWRMGGIIVGTSNKVPDDLYKNGVQRERLEPFVEALKIRCPVLTMRSDTDWRRERSGDGAGRTWYTYPQRVEFERLLDEVARHHLKDSHGRELNVFGRKVFVGWSAGDICKLSFDELCNESLGPADYLTLASTFRTLAITHIPVLKLSDKDQARRFISFIDAVYESRCRLLCLAEAEPEDIFFPDAQSTVQQHDVMMAESVAETQEKYRPNVSSYDAPNMANAPVASIPLPLDTLSIFSGQDEQFAFKRALSRLLEMTSAAYGKDELNSWMPLPADIRKWETTQGNSQTAGHDMHATATSNLGQQQSDDSDFSEEAACLRNESHLQRPPAPQLSPDHVWGVREDWGPGAKTWGKGSRKYDAMEMKFQPGGER